LVGASSKGPRDSIDTGAVVQKVDIRLERERRRRMAKTPLHSPNVASRCGNDRTMRMPEYVEPDRSDAGADACRIEYPPAILLHDAHGLSNSEIADLLGCSLATSKIRVHRARVRLRETLDTACSFEIDERGVLVCDPQPAPAIPASSV